MKRIIRFCLISVSVSMTLCACARAVQPPVIANEVEVAPRIPTLADNMAAYVWVYCFWRNPVNDDTTWDIEAGVVLDEIHVLTTHCENMTDTNGWEQAYLESMTIGSPEPDNESGHGLWSAHQVTASNYDNDLVILVTEDPIPLPSVIISTKAPELGDILYTITSDVGDPEVNEIDLLTVALLGNSQNSWSSATWPKPDFAVLMPYIGCACPEPAGVFNEQHEFVGFILDGPAYFVVPLKAPNNFQRSIPYGIGYDIAATGKTLKPLMLEANVQQQP